LRSFEVARVYVGCSVAAQVKTNEKPLNEEKHTMKNEITATERETNVTAPKWAASVNDTQIAVHDPTVSEDVLRTQGKVQRGHVIVRDHRSPDDVILKRGEIVDLREGNVFYTMPTAKAGPRNACASPAKLALFVGDEIGEIGTADQTGDSIRKLFELPDHVELFRDLRSPNDQPIELDSHVEFRDGPVFFTRRSTVEISINGQNYSTHRGRNTVAHLRTLGSIPANEILSQLKHGRFDDLPNDGHVKIKGGEVFVSHPASAGSSR
jgi:hypothetical protein